MSDQTITIVVILSLVSVIKILASIIKKRLK